MRFVCKWLIHPLRVNCITERPIKFRRHSNEKRKRSPFEHVATAAPTDDDNHDDHDSDDGCNHRDNYHRIFKRIQYIEKNSSMAIMKRKIILWYTS